MPLLLQGVGDFLGHVALIMLSEHIVGIEYAGVVERPFRHDPLPFAEQVRQDALKGDRNGTVAVGHLEAHRECVSFGNAAGRDEASEADAGAGRDVLLGDIGRRVEEDDRILERAEHEQNRDQEDAETRGDQDNAALLPRHQSINSLCALPLAPASHLRPIPRNGQPPMSRSLTAASRLRSLSGSLASAARASAIASFALAFSPSTL